MQEDFQFLGAFGVPNVKEIFVAHHTPLPVSGVLLHMGSVIACPRLHDNMCAPAFLAAMQNRCVSREFVVAMLRFTAVQVGGK